MESQAKDIAITKGKIESCSDLPNNEEELKQLNKILDGLVEERENLKSSKDDYIKEFKNLSESNTTDGPSSANNEPALKASDGDDNNSFNQNTVSTQIIEENNENINNDSNENNNNENNNESTDNDENSNNYIDEDEDDLYSAD